MSANKIIIQTMQNLGVKAIVRPQLPPKWSAFILSLKFLFINDFYAFSLIIYHADFSFSPLPSTISPILKRSTIASSLASVTFVNTVPKLVKVWIANLEVDITASDISGLYREAVLEQARPPFLSRFLESIHIKITLTRV